MKIKGKTALASALFVGAIFILGIRLLNPASIRLFVQGNETAITQIPGLFTLADVIVISLSTLVLAISGIYLLFFDSDSGSDSGETGSENKKTGGTTCGTTDETADWKEIAKKLDGDEKIIYDVILAEEGIMYQSELVAKTEFPKAKVTRCLDALENKGFLERKRKGMGNIVLLK